MSKITNGLLRKFNKKKEETVPPAGAAGENGTKCCRYTDCHVIESLVDVFSNPNAQLFFIQFMEAADRLCLIKFYLHVESFKASFSASLPVDDALKNLIKTDACNIYSQYLCADAPMNIGLNEDTRKRVIEAVCQTDGNITADCFDDAQACVWNQLSHRFYKEFLASVYYAKYLLATYTARQISTIDILKTHSLLCAFIEFVEDLEDNHAQNLLEFIISVRDSEQSQNDDSGSLVDDAMIIYDKYFSMQATNSLNFGDDIRILVEGKICTESGQPDPDAFERPYQLACTALQEQYIPEFVKSAALGKIIENLAMTVEHHIESPRHDISYNGAATNNNLPRSPVKRDSPSSPRWISNALGLRNRAMSFDPGTVASRTSCSNTSDDGRDDAASQCSSSSISCLGNSKTKETYGSLARVDELGRYTPLFDKGMCGLEELPGRSKLRSALDRYLNQSAAKESKMADEVARLIISDIQDMVAVGNQARK